MIEDKCVTEMIEQTCPDCNERVEMETKTRVDKMPYILIVRISRVVVLGGQYARLESPVEAPSEIHSDGAGHELTYRHIGTICHHGTSPDSGTHLPAYSDTV